MKAPSITGGHIEVSPIRLSQEEARIVMQVAVAGKPIPGTYQYRQLAELGILKAIDIPEEKDTARKIADAWKKARGGFAQKDCDIVHQAMHDIEKLHVRQARGNLLSGQGGGHAASIEARIARPMSSGICGTTAFPSALRRCDGSGTP